MIKLQWPSIIVTAWIVLAATVTPAKYMSASSWFEVRSVFVSDTVVGVPAKITVDRSINQPFIGEWTVTIRQLNERGYAAFCSATGQVRYSPGAVIPPNADLDWWTWPTKCNLPAGRYHVDTAWQIELAPDVIKIVTNRSNEFEVR